MQIKVSILKRVFKVYTILGKIISVWKIEENAESYKLPLKLTLPTGVYFSKITTNQGERNKKIIIQ